MITATTSIGVLGAILVLGALGIYLYLRFRTRLTPDQCTMIDQFQRTINQLGSSSDAVDFLLNGEWDNIKGGINVNCVVGPDQTPVTVNYFPGSRKLLIVIEGHPRISSRHSVVQHDDGTYLLQLIKLMTEEAHFRIGEHSTMVAIDQLNELTMKRHTEQSGVAAATKSKQSAPRG